VNLNAPFGSKADVRRHAPDVGSRAASGHRLNVGIVPEPDLYAGGNSDPGSDDMLMLGFVHVAASNPKRCPYADTLAMKAAIMTSPAILTARGMSFDSTMTAALDLLSPKMSNPE
jgi:hypothetical protein